MSVADLTEYPITEPVRPVRIEAWPTTSVDGLPGRSVRHVSSTVRLAPAGIGVAARRARHWQVDAEGRKRVGRARRRADRRYRTWKSWSAISLDQVTDPEELQELVDLEELAWHKFEDADRWATDLRDQHIRCRRRRGAMLTLGTAAPAVLGAWVLSVGGPVHDVLNILGAGLVGSYIFGLVGRQAQHRAGERERRRPQVELVGKPAPEISTSSPFLIEPAEDRFQLLRDIMATRRDGETGVWTQVLVRRLKEDEQFGTLYSTLTGRDLRQMLREFDIDPDGTSKARMTVTPELLEHLTQYHPEVTAELGQSKPLAGYHYDLQIRSALALGEATHTNHESEIYQ
jgi:hypothetical protein